MTAQKYLRAADVARLTGVSVRTVRRWIADGVLPSVKIGGTRLVEQKAVRKTASSSAENDAHDDVDSREDTDAYDLIGKTSPE